MHEMDAPQVAQIWRDGLEQTAESYVLLKPLMGYLLHKYGDNAMTLEGDVGPQGRNLVDAWISKKDCTMLVACDNAQKQKCIGCIGVKVGKDMKQPESGSTVASVWRMSVEKSVRRQGVGLSLMHAAEEWAQQRECKSMVLETTNKIAAQFYTAKAGYREEPFPKETSLFLHYLGIVKIYTKSLDLGKDAAQMEDKNR